MKANRNVYRCLTYISQFAINMLVPIFLCSYVGYWLDGKLGTQWLFIAFFFLGAFAGGRNIYILARRVFDEGGSRPSRLYGTNRSRRK